MMNQFTLLCLGVLGLSSSALAQTDTTVAKPVAVKSTTKRVVKKTPTKAKTLPQPTDIAAPKAKTYRSRSIQDAIPVKNRVSLGFYGFNGSLIAAADQYFQLGYKVMPGMSLAAGSSLTTPSDFYFALLDFHANDPIAGFAPSFQIGYSGFSIDDGISTTNDSGLLIGFGLAYPINQFADLDLNFKNVSSKVNLGDNEFIASLGIKINF